ncbi:MAG TPA: MerR family transcriptional regulator [Candidatus Omnitrophota bacterium]|nr:MerR family transcriptional regulator [Candidatus Omnitrophota bacterium]HPT07807.1 MerR family transcriptional regulator [Candidatus Omnitrophota bacterium]
MGYRINHTKGSRMVSVVKVDPKFISAKELVSNFHITYQTVNHYTDFGLLPVSLKRGNVRFYDRLLVSKRLREIKDLTKEGYSLRLIRKRLIGI